MGSEHQTGLLTFVAGAAAGAAAAFLFARAIAAPQIALAEAGSHPGRRRRWHADMRPIIATATFGVVSESDIEPPHRRPPPLRLGRHHQIPVALETS